MMIIKKIVLMLVAIHATVVHSKLDTEKLADIFSDSEILQVTHIKKDIFEVKILKNQNRIKTTTFFTNSNIDWVAPSLAITENSSYKQQIPTPQTKEIILDNQESITIGEGEVKNHFINPTTEIGIKKLSSILMGNGFKNNIFIHYSLDSPTELLFSIPLYYGSNQDRILEIGNYLKLMAALSSGVVSPEKANKMMENTIDQIKSESSETTITEMSNRMKENLELYSLFGKGREYISLTSQNIEATTKPIKFDQKLENFDFSKYGSDLSLALEDATAFTIGNGDNHIYVFSDIDCPACAKFESQISNKLKTTHTFHILYYPLQKIHPNALDKSRYVLSHEKAQRHKVHIRVSGSKNSPRKSRVGLLKLSTSKFKSATSKVEMSKTLGELLRVSSTPTLMKFDKSKLKQITIQELIQ